MLVLVVGILVYLKTLCRWSLSL